MLEAGQHDWLSSLYLISRPLTTTWPAINHLICFIQIGAYLYREHKTESKQICLLNPQGSEESRKKYCSTYKIDYNFMEKYADVYQEWKDKEERQIH